MTPEEVAQAYQKFHDYLAANGVEVKAYLMHFDDTVAGTGSSDALLGGLLSMLADSRGYKVVRK